MESTKGKDFKKSDKKQENNTRTNIRVSLNNLTQVSDLTLFMCNLPGLTTNEDSQKLEKDFEKLKNAGITCIVNLLNKYEMRAHGVDLDKYLARAGKLGIEVILYDIVEMDAPQHIQSEFDKKLIQPVVKKIKNKEKVMVHCRAGVGRAGLVVSCLLLNLRLYSKHEEVIAYLRTVRHPNTVESDKQKRYIKGYQMFLEATTEDFIMTEDGLES